MNFGCTKCGKCCNRSPELELSETIGLADAFIFRLMFRPYELANSLGDYLGSIRPEDRSKADSQIYYAKRKLLKEESFWSYMGRSRFANRGGLVRKYVVISAITVDRGIGECDQLTDGLCQIHDRRPLSCQTVPFHYSRVDSELEAVLREFVGRPDYMCDTSSIADEAIRDGKLIDQKYLDARRAARSTMSQDQKWKEAIAENVWMKQSITRAFPTRRQIADSDQVGAPTIEIFHAWKLACEIGVIRQVQYRQLLGKQHQILKRQVELCFQKGQTPGAKQYLGTLMESAREYVTEVGRIDSSLD